MADLSEIKTLISSNKSLGYSSLLIFQEQSGDDSSSVQALARESHILLSLFIADMFDDDEEIAAQALKCLGFIIYHPSIVFAVTVEDANLVLESLTKLITATRIKSVCNLGVWCISIQQFNAYILAAHFQSLLRAIVHALDNPIGSLSITFEAIQAIIKLATQLSEKMREASDVWTPPIYRRLLSLDKRERDMSERCLLKIRSIILPPPLTLSQALVLDMKNKLLPGMKEMLRNGLKVQCMQAWGWFVRFLGSQAMKNKHITNEMLKVPEQTFSDHNPQVQIASQVAWEGLVDALIQPPEKAPEANITQELDIQSAGPSKADGFLKSLKLIMTPLTGTISSKCDSSVHLSCLNTWHYLLHKLDTFVNDPSVIEHVVEPIFEAVFQIPPDTKSTALWNFCLDVFNDSISAKCVDMNPAGPKNHPIRWLPWNLNYLCFHLKMIHVIISHGSMASLKSDTTLKLFRSVLKGVQLELKSSSINYDEIMLCLKTLLSFVKQICEDSATEESGILFAETVVMELEPSILGSPLYKLALDVKYIENLHSVNERTHKPLLGTGSIVYMDMVSPVVYLTILYFSVVIQSSNAAKTGLVKYINILLSLNDPSENLHVIVDLLYNHTGSSGLKLWMVIAKVLEDHTDGIKDPSLVKALLRYPFFVYSCPVEQLTQTKNTTLEHENVTEVWKSLYSSLKRALRFEWDPSNGFVEDLCSIINGCLDESTDLNCDLYLLSLSGDVAICFLKQMAISEVNSKRSKSVVGGDSQTSNGFKNSLGFVARFLKLAFTKTGSDSSICHAVTSRVFLELECFVDRLHSKCDIISFMEIISSPLLLWLSKVDTDDQTIVHQLQLIWTKTPHSLESSSPPLTFDSSLLKLQTPLLEKTLDHPNPDISKPTMTFWDSTYGNKINLDYPQSLLHVLDKLSRNGLINLHNRSPPFLEKCRSRVTSTQNRSSKRVEFVDDRNRVLKRKRLELTEHQKEVRRAQQGREMDCNGHGPGIRTYTSVDFSQGNEESQESQEIRDPDSILEMLRKDL